MKHLSESAWDRVNIRVHGGYPVKEVEKGCVRLPRHGGVGVVSMSVVREHRMKSIKESKSKRKDAVRAGKE